MDSAGKLTKSGTVGLRLAGIRPHYDPITDLVCSDGGSVISPISGESAGLLKPADAVVPDAALNRAFVLNQPGLAPAAILAGNADTLITVTGAGFGIGSVIQLDGATLTSSVLSSTQLTATVPSASIAALGWRSVPVANPGSGGGVSTPQALSVYEAIKLGANRVLYDPFSQRFFATLGSAMPSGNLIETVVPKTGMVSTPVYLGSEPTRLALSDDGQVMYVLLMGLNQVVRYNMQTQQPEQALTLRPYSGGTSGGEITIQPGSEDTIATYKGGGDSIRVADFDPVAHTAVYRAGNSGYISGSYLRFLDASNLLFLKSTTLQRFSVTASGLVPRL